MKVAGMFLLIVFAGVVIASLSVRSKPSTAPEIQASAQASPVPTQKVIAPVMKTSDLHSPDGTKKLSLRSNVLEDGTARYALYVSDVDGSHEKFLFEKVLPAGTSLSLPFNAWDPKNVYIFFKQTGGAGTQYFVTRTDGAPFAGGNQFLSVSDVWQEKNKTYQIRDITGWASETLLIVYTNQADGTKGPAFWFEIPSTAIIQLAG